MPRRKNIGERTRFSGFFLGESDRDRIVAEWIDAQPNAAESIKALIYAVATGQATYGAPVASGAGRVSDEAEGETLPTIDLSDPRTRALASLDT